MTERQPTSDELAAMAYADGELSGTERAHFEERLAREPELSRRVAAQRRLAVLARAATPLEPAEQEWARLERELGQRALARGGRWVLALALALLLAGTTWCLWSSALASWVKVGISAALLGAVMMIAAAWRARARTRGLDPYEDVKR